MIGKKLIKKSEWKKFENVSQTKRRINTIMIRPVIIINYIK